jgi:hypothetical protein
LQCGELLNAIKLNISNLWTWIVNKLSSGGAVAMQLKMFPKLEDKMSIYLEEVIKTLPFGGLFVSLVEIKRDVDEGNFNWLKAVTRIGFHCIWELLPTWFLLKLILLPIRILIHVKANNYLKDLDQKHTKRVKLPETVRLGPILTVQSEDRYDTPVQDFTMPRYVTTVEPTIFKEIPPPIWECYEFAKTNLPDPNPYFIGNSHDGGSYPAKSTVNFVRAIEDRGYQPLPKKDLDNKFKIVFDETMQRLSKKMTYKQIDFEEWAQKSDKYHFYKHFYEKVGMDYDKIVFKWELQLKLNEMLFKEKPRIIHATDPTYTVIVGPMMASIQDALKDKGYGVFNGYTDLKDVFGLDKPFYVLYASCHTNIVEEFFTRSLEDPNAYFLAVVGDDTALTHLTKVLAMDMSRFDSTQNAWYHQSFARHMFPSHTDENGERTAFYPMAERAYRTQQNAPTTYTPPEAKTGNRPKSQNVPPVNGLKTGCMETSISNTVLMTISVALALLHGGNKSFTKVIPQYLQEVCGFLPKSNISTLKEGFEFLKKGWIVSHNKVKCIPLLSNFGKLGKSEKDFRTIVPNGKYKSMAQASVDFDYGMINSMFERNSFPMMIDLFTYYEKEITVSRSFQVLDPDHAYKFTHKGASMVTDDEVLDYWTRRYEITPDDVYTVFEDLKKNCHDRPRRYKNLTLSRALDVDYGR